MSSNGIDLSIVQADFSVTKGEISELAKMIAKKKVAANGLINEMLEKNEEAADFIVYGANLTFVNLEKATFYGLELRGQKPVFANYTINGVGEEGVVLVLPGPNKGCNDRTVTLVLPEDQIEKLKNELEKDWGIVA